MRHELKISPKYFDAVAQGIKTFEVRKNDRGFAVGDTLWLREYDADAGLVEAHGYTFRKCHAVVTYILDDKDYCPEGYVILGIRVLKKEE